MLVVKIGGCNGSGKTSLVRALIAELNLQPVQHPTKPKRISAYTGKLGAHTVWVLGSYANTCGGMDTISDKHERMALVKQYAIPKSKNIVIFEGLITGKTYGALGTLSCDEGHYGNWIYAFMDTPFNECVRRVLERRINAGNDAPFDPTRTMLSTFKSVQSVRAKASSEKYHSVYDIKHNQKPGVAARLLLQNIQIRIGD